MRNTHKCALLTIASAVLLVAQTDPPGRVGRLNYTTGPVSFQPAGMTEWVDATVNRPLAIGDQVWVGDRARSELHVGSTALRLGPNTAFQFLNLDDETVQIRLSDGTISVRLRNLDPGQVFEIDTPNLAFTLLRPGEYRIDADADAMTTTITVRNGDGEATGGGQVMPLRSGQRIIVRGGDQLTYSLLSSPQFDEWDQWCSGRDRREEQSQSVRYVSREMTGYEDLDQYGRWDNQPGYGNVWMPTSVSAGWAPYHYGHWVWISPWGWTWVDDAPWGFAPYHYGRWASFSGRWGWVPGPYGVRPIYAPALVGWIGGGRGGLGFSLSFSFGMSAAVGWFPLGPREPYFPSYQASQGYFTRVNNTNTVINNTTINNYYGASRNPTGAPISDVNYINRGMPNGVTAIPQESFARGRGGTQDVRTVSASQLSATQVYGAPAIAPQKEGVLGARADTASRAPRPSAKVQNQPVVARSAPPSAVAPFDRQQSELKQNPGRALDSRQLRQGSPASSVPVRVVDMNRVQRVQPSVGDAQQQPATTDRQPQQQQRPQRTDRPPQQQTAQPQVERQQQQQQLPRADRPQQQQSRQPQPVERPQQQQPVERQPQVERPQQQQQQQPRADRPQQQQSRQPQQVERPQPQQQPVERQPQFERPQPQQQQQPRADRPQQQSRQPQQVERPQPQTERPQQQQRQEKGKPDRPQKEDPGEKKPLG